MLFCHQHSVVIWYYALEFTNVLYYCICTVLRCAVSCCTLCLRYFLQYEFQTYIDFYPDYYWLYVILLYFFLPLILLYSHDWNTISYCKLNNSSFGWVHACFPSGMFGWLKTLWHGLHWAATSLCHFKLMVWLIENIHYHLRIVSKWCKGEISIYFVRILRKRPSNFKVCLNEIWA